ncbi:hypothetical protein C2I36_07800 [Rhodobacteraceae bacterium WD3A24]|nr:hypothetical protein C2I36_07800 [Rhodobacteraceae bacterium WD3A24]
MMVFWEQRLVFLATPKTGSTAIEAALDSMASFAITRPPELKHTPAYRYRRFLRPFLEGQARGAFTVVAMMREPVDWLGSWYRFRQREEILDPSRSTAEMDFDAFVAGYIAEPRARFADVGSQARFLAPPDGQPGALGVDRLFRYEEIDAFVDFLEDRLDCEIILPRLNVSPAGATDLSPGMAERLRAHAAADFALYDSLRAAGG